MGPLPPARLIGWRARKQTLAREARDMRERRDQKFEVRGSNFRKPRTFARPACLASPVRLSCGGVPKVQVLLVARRAFPFLRLKLLRNARQLRDQPRES